MSLNWLEINKVLEELPLEGSFLQNIRQISFTKLIFEHRSPGRSFNILICLDRSSLRLHEITGKYQSLPKPPRFTAYMRSRIKGARVVAVRQIGSDRIIKMELKKGDRTDRLYIRLWGGAANLILCDSGDVILDAFSRRPARKEIPGEIYAPEPGDPPRKEMTVRNIPEDFDSFSSCLEEFYDQSESRSELLELRKKVRKDLEYRENGLRASLKNQEERLREYEKEEQYREFGDILMSSLSLLKRGQKEFTCETGEVIPLDKALTPVENAQKYYKKAGKAARGRELREQEAENLKNRLKKVSDDLKNLDRFEDPEALRSLVPEEAVNKKGGSGTTPGLTFTSGSFTILVGRSAKENETLLSRHVRGNDYWLHTRDYPGAYVFIRLPRGKSVPLTTLLDAGNLALFYSKAKDSGAGDLYCTQVKYLRKPKEGKKGLVLPTREKNLYVKLDESRIQRLKDPSASVG